MAGPVPAIHEHDTGQHFATLSSPASMRIADAHAREGDPGGRAGAVKDGFHGGQFDRARVGIDYRALAVPAGKDIVWFWIGPHSEYDTLTRS